MKGVGISTERVPECRLTIYLPAWFRETADLLDEMEKILKAAREKRFYTLRKPPPPPSRWSG